MTRSQRKIASNEEDWQPPARPREWSVLSGNFFSVSVIVLGRLKGKNGTYILAPFFGEFATEVS